jgi:hypothetical protein
VRDDLRRRDLGIHLVARPVAAAPAIVFRNFRDRTCRRGLRRTASRVSAATTSGDCDPIKHTPTPTPFLSDISLRSISQGRGGS